MSNTGFMMFLRNVVNLLSVIPTKELQEHVDSCRGDLERAESFGCFTDPTAYMKALEDGSFTDARNQLEIVKYLLGARQAIDKREADREKILGNVDKSE